MLIMIRASPYFLDTYTEVTFAFQLFFLLSSDLLLLHSFPTRRSSDLVRPGAARDHLLLEDGERALRVVARSEEHTSELQSHSDLVCRLLLEKKKKTLQVLRAQLQDALAQSRAGNRQTGSEDGQQLESV